MNAPVNHIIHQSCVDGPGNRSVVFFQGCNFSCNYCHNPETIKLCSSCGACVEGCPRQALSLKDEMIHWDETRCIGCDLCIRTCPHNASPRVRMMTPEQVIEQIRGDLPFIRGITASGGECSLHRDFIVELFQKARELGLSTLLDSNGGYDFAADLALLSLCDGVMLDIKCYDALEHLNLTSQPNSLVLKNAVYLAQQHKLPEIRTVVVPDVLPNEQTVEQVSLLLSPYLSQTNIRYKLIRFRPFGVRDPYRSFSVPSVDLMEKLRLIAAQNGFTDIMVV